MCVPVCVCVRLCAFAHVIIAVCVSVFASVCVLRVRVCAATASPRVTLQTYRYCYAPH